MGAEDKPKGEEGMLEEDRPLEARENAAEVGTSLDMVDTMGMQELSQGVLWQVHGKEELMREVQSTKAAKEQKKLHMAVQMVHSLLLVSTIAQAQYCSESTTE
ncbi:hypothetical protein ACJRO7_010914 [Eucalyptus globulus]|uniref:Uncharacterized protein n=1 Tax=Eucalyptus globulus TaxID=34317 RepID=A0ABD3LNE1_EUCGL